MHESPNLAVTLRKSCKNVNYALKYLKLEFKSKKNFQSLLDCVMILSGRIVRNRNWNQSSRTWLLPQFCILHVDNFVVKILFLEPALRAKFIV